MLKVVVIGIPVIVLTGSVNSVNSVQELAAFEKYGDKTKLGALKGDTPFAKFSEAFHRNPTVRSLRQLQHI
jgi:hypothetical protein